MHRNQMLGKIIFDKLKGLVPKTKYKKVLKSINTKINDRFEGSCKSSENFNFYETKTRNHKINRK